MIEIIVYMTSPQKKIIPLKIPIKLKELKILS